ncbi:hypothetical protein DIC82_08550 [Clostridium beijerinckii]|nr:hypothetical protein DIC82_08550 [Clostridium beijerinckii]
MKESEKIKNMRSELNDMLNSKNLLDNEVLVLSQKIDLEIVNYMRRQKDILIRKYLQPDDK